jgi:hypothetical protein
VCLCVCVCLFMQVRSAQAVSSFGYLLARVINVNTLPMTKRLTASIRNLTSKRVHYYAACAFYCDTSYFTSFQSIFESFDSNT